jgi:hypothetical protein
MPVSRTRYVGFGKSDLALPSCYPLSIGTPDMRECEPGSTRRLALEARVLDDVRAVGWGYDRLLLPI